MREPAEQAFLDGGGPSTLASDLLAIPGCSGEEALAAVVEAVPPHRADIAADALADALELFRSASLTEHVRGFVDATDDQQTLDGALADWWASDPPARVTVWAAAGEYCDAGARFVAWLIVQAHWTGLARTRALLVCDLIDLLAVGPEAGEVSVLRRLGVWIDGHALQPARTRHDTPFVFRRISRVWSLGVEVDREDLDELLIMSGVVGAPIVAEFDGGFHRHVLDPLNLAQSDDLRSDTLCLHRASDTHGWLSVLGFWAAEEA